jgi:Tfp pilus assembly protein PilN
MRPVNLLPGQNTGKKSGIDRTLAVGLAVTGIVFVALLGGFFIEKANADSAKQALTTIQDSLSRAQSRQPSTHAPAPTHLQTPVVLSQEQPWRLALDSALATRVPWDTLLAQLEYVVPPKVTLTNVTFGAAGTTGGTITLTGSAFSSNDVAEFMSVLARVPKLTAVTLTNTQTSAGSKVVTFEITAQMTLPTPPVSPLAATTTTGATG